MLTHTTHTIIVIKTFSFPVKFISGCQNDDGGGSYIWNLLVRERRRRRVGDDEVDEDETHYFNRIDDEDRRV